MWKLQKLFVAKLNQISSGGLNLPATHFASINQLYALRILSFILRATDFYLRL